MLGEISQAERQILYDITYMCTLKQNKNKQKAKLRKKR